MNREIKFRGKRLGNGEFIFGALAFFFNQPDNTCIMPNCFFGTRDFGEVDEEDNTIISDEIALGGFINVDSKTIGQYTGLKDKNGKEIYEGDIIEKIQYNKSLDSGKSAKVRYVVKWYEQTTSDNDFNNEQLEKDPSVFNECPGFYGKEIYNPKKYYHHGWSEFASCEIIGNVHENPELLNNEK